MIVHKLILGYQISYLSCLAQCADYEERNCQESRPLSPCKENPPVTGGNKG